MRVKCKEDFSFTAMWMTSSSRDIYFHMASGNQTKLGPAEKKWFESFIMSMPSSAIGVD